MLWSALIIAFAAAYLGEGRSRNGLELQSFIARLTKVAPYALPWVSPAGKIAPCASLQLTVQCLAVLAGQTAHDVPMAIYKIL